MKIIEVFRASPLQEPENLPTKRSLPLTFFDILWLRLPPVQRLFFYEFPHPTPLFYESLLPKLKHSLSLTLDHFYPLCGHLTWPLHPNKPIIKYTTNDAVSLTVAESDADFNHLSGTNLCEATKSHHLVPQLTITDEQASILALQVTLFPNCGFSIGITSHHAVLDGKSSTSFMKSWAYLSKKLVEQKESESRTCSLPPELTPFCDRSVIKDPNGIDAKYVSDWLKQGGPNNRSLMVWDLKVPQDAIRGIFELSRQNIEKLKQFVVGTMPKGDLRLSTFIVSLAYAWVCRVKAEEIENKRVSLALNVDCRARLDPPLPPTYFGNCIANRLAVVETSRISGENGLIVAVEALSEALETLKDGVLSGAETWCSMLHDNVNRDDKVIGGAGSPRFEVYSCDFGWGRPKKVEMVSIDRTGAVCLSDSRNGDGVEICLVCKESVMMAFASHFVKGIELLC